MNRPSIARILYILAWLFALLATPMLSTFCSHGAPLRASFAVVHFSLLGGAVLTYVTANRRGRPRWAILVGAALLAAWPFLAVVLFGWVHSWLHG